MTDQPLDTARAILAELIAVPTVSAESNLALIDRVESRLAALGARTRRSLSPCGRKANLFATLGPERAGGIVLSGHTDVVPAEPADWSTDPFEAVEREGRIHGRGACDMKGFLACALALAPRFAETRLARPLHLAFTYDEEVGCLGAPVLLGDMAEAGIRPAFCIVGEPTSMRAVEGHKGMCEYTTRFRGLSGHGSAPERGVSAVEYAARYVSRLLELRGELRARVPEGSPYDPPWSTLQVGRVAGGVSHNVIAEHAEVDWELRPVRRDDRDRVLSEIDRYAAEELLPAMRAVHPAAAIAREVIGEVEGLDPADAAEAARLVAGLTGRDARDCVAFGTEAGIFARHGISTVVCGPGSIEQAHRPDEYVALSQLSECLGMISRLLPRLAA
jgi:acetylornithine deacetylase